MSDSKLVLGLVKMLGSFSMVKWHIPKEGDKSMATALALIVSPHIGRFCID